MSIPFQHREEACYKFISSGFKLEDTVAWMMTTYKDNPTILKAKYPEKLCANTVMMGSDGDQRQLNIAAFGNAYRRYESESVAQATEAGKADVARMAEDFKALRAEHDAAQRELREAHNSIQRHLGTINRLDRENTIFHLKAGDDPDVGTEAQADATA